MIAIVLYENVKRQAVLLETYIRIACPFLALVSLLILRLHKFLLTWEL